MTQPSTSKNDLTSALAYFASWPLIFLYLPAFYQPFRTPKTIYFLLLSFVASLLLLRAPEWRIPDKPRSLKWLAISIAILLFSYNHLFPYEWCLSFSLYLSAIVLFFTLFHCGSGVLEKMARGFIDAVTFQAFAILLGWLSPSLIGGALSLRDDKGAIGFVGNSEFLSTILGAGFLTTLRLTRRTSTHLVRLGIIGAAIPLTANKGTLFLVCVLTLAYLLPLKAWHLKWGTFVSLLSLFAVSLYKPAFIAGRLFLYLVGGKIFLDHWISGTGLGLFGHYYFDALTSLFRKPLILGTFGSYSALASDAHNLPLNLLAELGLGGAILTVLFFALLFNLIRRAPSSRLALVFIAIKSLFTVTITAISSLGLLVLLVAEASCADFRSKAWRPTPRWRAMLALCCVSSTMGVLFLSNDFWYGLAYSHHFKGHLALADRYATRAILIYPQHADAWLMKANVSFLSGDLTSMNHAIQEAVHASVTIDTLKQGAALYFHSRQYLKSIDCNEKILKAYPEHLATMARLAQAYSEEGEKEKAFALALKILDTEPRIKNKRDGQYREIATALLLRKGGRL